MQWEWTQTRVDVKEQETNHDTTKKKSKQKKNKKSLRVLSREHSWLLDSEPALLYMMTNNVTSILERHVEASSEIPVGS
jgi:hypothetical protein